MRHRATEDFPWYLLFPILVVLGFPLIAHALPGDIDGSGIVDGYDLIAFGHAYGSTPGAPNWNSDADLNGDGKVDDADLDILSIHFGRSGFSFGLWVVDQAAGSQGVSKLSLKGNLLFRVGTFTSPSVISSNVSDGSVWVGDLSLDKIKKLDPSNGATLLTVNGIEANSLSVNSRDGSVWVVDYRNDRVIKLLPTITDGYNIGTSTGSHIIVLGFSRPRSISVNSETGAVWVADAGNHRMVRLSPDIPDGYNLSTNTGKHTVKTGFSDPASVSVNSSDGTVWVGDSGNHQIVKLSETGGMEILRVGKTTFPYDFDDPRSLAVNTIDGSLWVADYMGKQVLRLASDGSIVAKTGGFNYPTSVAVNLLDGTCWVADYSNDQVVKLSPNGAELARIGGFDAPTALTLVPDRGTGSKSPVALVSLSSNHVDTGQTITFTGTGNDPDGTIVLYEWDFDGDGIFDYKSATTGETTHFYSITGIYNPVFRVTDNDGLTATDYSQLVRVGRLKAIAGADKTSGNAPLTVNLTAGFVDPINGMIDNYQWDFDGDGIFDYFSEATGDKTYTYTRAGTYQATLKIVDGPYTAFDTITIQISPSPPLANAAASPASGILPLTVTFTGSGTDPDGSVMLHSWDFDGDGTYDWFSVSNGNTSYTYKTNGSFTARFRVMDNDGLSDVKELPINVRKIPPVAVANATPRKGHPPLSVSFDATGSYDPDGTIKRYEWSFGDFAFFDDVEGDTSNWTAQYPWGVATCGRPDSPKCWTDSPGGNYSNNANTSLTSRTIDLSGVSSAILTYWHHHEMQHESDYGYVEVSQDGGSTWSVVASYTGSLPLWTKAEIDLSPFLPSSNLKMRFRLSADDYSTRDGWYIDEVSVSIFAWATSPDGTATHVYSHLGIHRAALRVTDNEDNQAMDTIDIQVYPLWKPLVTGGASPRTGTAPLTVFFTGTGTDPGGTIPEYRWNFGEEYVWVADTSKDQVARLYQDGSGEVVRKAGFDSPYAVSVNPADGTAWVADYSNNQVVRLSADGRTELVRVSGLYNPIALSVDPADGTVWVSDCNRDQLVKLKPDGSGEILRKGGVNCPQSISINPNDGTLWVADSGNNQVVKLSADGTEHARLSGFNYPVFVAVNPSDGTAWVADYNNGKVAKLKADGSGEIVRVSGFSKPRSVSVDARDGTTWVADSYRGEVVKLKADGSGQVFKLKNFDTPVCVSVNSSTGEAWVVEREQVVKLGPEGKELARLSGFYYPMSVSVADTGASNSFISSVNGNTNHVYSVPGIYKAILTATDNEGNQDTEAFEIRVYGIPTVTARANVTAGQAPLEVFLFGAATDLDGTHFKYEWDFDGDGTYDWSSSNVSLVRHVYKAAGTYHARLRATDIDGYTNTDTLTITVDPASPSASAGAAPLQGNAPLSVNFFGSGDDPDGTIALYEWDFDGDGTYDWSSPATPDTIYNYNTPKSNPGYLTKLRVTDNNGLQATSTVEINVYPAGTPSALLYAEPTQGIAPLTVRFCGHGIDQDGTISLYEWDLDGDGAYEISSGDPPTVFGDKMEDGEGYWTADPPWARVYSDYYSPPFSWTDSPGGNYANNVNASLTSRTIDLSGALSPRLIFWHRYDFNYGDYGRVEVSGNNGANWTQIGEYTGGTIASWTRQEYSLSAYRGNATVKIRFRVTTNDSDTGDGWHIDDVWVGDCVYHTYPDHGRFDVKLRVTDDDARQAVASQEIEVFAPENASYTWVADSSNNQVVKLSEDGRSLARISGFSYPGGLKVDQTSGDIWVVDAGGRVVKLLQDEQNGYDITKTNTPDKSPNRNGGVLYGNAALVSGKIGNGLSLGSSSDYVQIPHSSVFQMASWTLEAWIKASSTGTSGQVRTIVGKGSQYKEFGLVLNGSQIAVLIYQGGRKYVKATESVTTGVWYHIAGVYDAPAGKVRLYVDGTLAAEGAYSPDTSSTEPLLIGKSYSYYGENFYGMIDEVRIWNVARSGEEISANINAELGGSDPRLVGYWQFNGARPPFQVTTGFSYPWAIDVMTTDPSAPSAWVADYYGNKVVKLKSDGTVEKSITGFSNPQGISIYQKDGEVWVANTGVSKVIKLDASGNKLLEVSGFEQPAGISADQADGCVWVADTENNQIVKLSQTGTILYRIGGFNKPRGLSVNPNDGTLWVADYSNNQAVKLSPNGSEILRVDGFYIPYMLDVNPKDGSAWITDFFHDQVVKLSPDGTVLLRLDGFYRPAGISIDAGLRNLTSPPVAASTVTPTSGDSPLVVTFDGSATGTIVRYQWDFDGDGSFDFDSSTTGHATYTYTFPGAYNPVFRVTDSAGMMDYDASHTICVGPLTVLPTVSPSMGNAPLDATLDASIKGVLQDRKIMKYEWDFEGDSVFDWTGTNLTGPKVTHRYATGANYTPTLRVTDSLGNQAYGSTTLVVNKTAPTVTNITSPLNGRVPLNVNLGATGSDADGSIVLYEWDYDGDGTYDWFSKATATAFYTYSAVGTYYPTIRVTDNDGLSAAAAVTITVTQRTDPPIVSVAADLSEGYAPFTVTLTAAATDPDDGQIVLYEWDFDGDGTYDWNSTTTGNTSHTYTVPGQYHPTFRVKDADNLTATASLLITVKSSGAPRAVASGVPTSGPTPLTVQFSGEGSSDPDGSIVFYEWTFGDEVVWIPHPGKGAVLRFQGYREDRRVTGFSLPYRLAVNPSDGTVWVTDTGKYEVTRLGPDGEVLARAGGFNVPGAIAVNSIDGSAWVIDRNNNQVVKLSPEGAELVRKGGFYQPSGIAVNSSDGTVWVADGYNYRVVRLRTEDGAEQATIKGFSYPVWVSVDPKDGSAWVADQSAGKVVKLAKDTPDGYDTAVARITPNLISPDKPGLVFGNGLGASGRVNGAISLDGSGGYVLIPRHSALDVQSFTIEAWVKPVDTYGTPAIFMRGNAAGGDEMFFGFNNNTTLHTILDGTSNTFTKTPSTNFVDGNWHHVALVYDAALSQLSCYVDGVAYGSAVSISKTLDFGLSHALIGADFDSLNGSLGNYFKGLIDEVRLWSIARSAAEIAASKDTELTGSETGLAGYWRMDSVVDTPYHRSLSGFSRPICTSVNPIDGSAWVCDESAVVKVMEDASRQILRLTGISGSSEISVNPGDGTLWVARTGGTQIFKLSAEGREILRLQGIDELTSAYSIGVFNPPSNRSSSPTSGNATHVYTRMGEYIATLKVTGNSGTTDTDSVVIRAGGLPESLPRAYPTTGTAPLTVRFYSDAKSPQGTIIAYYWDFNGDGMIDNDYTQYVVPLIYTYVYQRPGTYLATLKVGDIWGWTDTRAIPIVVLPPDSKPTAKAMADPVEGNSPLPVSFTGLGSDFDGLIKNFEWDFGDGTEHYVSPATGRTTHTYNSPGLFTARLTVTDNDGNTGTDTVGIQVKTPGLPIATASANPGSGVVALNVTFTGTGTDNGTIVKYEWDFDGDGTYDWSSATSGNTSFSYTKAGTYLATLRVTDNDGLTDTANVKITVAPGLKAFLSSDTVDPTIGETVQICSVLTDSATVTVKVKDNVGSVVRTLVNNAPRTSGYYADPWDGKNGSGQIVAPGVYFYVIEYTSGGVTYVYDVTHNVSSERYAPIVTYPENFNPFNAETNFFRYALDSKSEVTIYMCHWAWGGYWGAGPRVKTLLLRKPQKAGSYVMVWDGTDDSGTLVEPGEYLIAVWGERLPENAIIVAIEPIVSDLLVSPIYLNPAGKPYDPANQSRFTYTLSKTADVTATILDSENYLVKTITATNVSPGGGNTFVWDGKDQDNKYVRPGVYRLRLVATDGFGNRSLDANAVMVIFY